MECSCGGSTVSKKHTATLNKVKFDLHYESCASCSRNGRFTFKDGDSVLHDGDAIDAFDQVSRLVGSRAGKLTGTLKNTYRKTYTTPCQF